ncbi:MAG: aminotransferase class I/II-fold pyridoxal phosphate-dependent enzyme, partial [Coriobacteriia bacterium]|nr:aminotransferase class I/II-fold pyridoxal phosphate-dependent enzyme [Coriobacteriia bacterium]
MHARNYHFRKALDKLSAYQPGIKIEQVKDVCPDIPIAQLSSNESPDGPTPAVLEAISKMALTLNRYPDGSAKSLKEAIAQFYGVKPEEVLVGAGLNEIINLLALAIMEATDNAVFPWPSFVVYLSAQDTIESQSIKVALTQDYELDLQAMLDAIDEHTRLVYICNPNNPTSTIKSEEALDEFMSKIPDHVLVLFDEAYFEFVDTDKTTSGLKYFSRGNVIVGRTFSKIYGLAGLRCGYVLAPEAIVKAVDKVRAPFNVNSLAYAACSTALDDQVGIEKKFQANKAAREAIMATLEEEGYSFAKSQSNFVYFKTKDAKKFYDALLEH